MLAATSLSLSFGGQQVLTDVSLTLDRTSRASLVGANGSGKTSLLRILAGVAQPDGGATTTARSATVAYLPQQSNLPPEKTIREIADQGFHREQILLEERKAQALLLSRSPHDNSLLQSVAQIDELLETSGFHTRHVQIHRILRGLGFSADALEEPVGTLSGGWAMRVALARTLLTRPDFLLLDEPTNYLDSESRLWLSSFLNTFPGGYLLVSHDRAFLDETITEVLELFQGRLKRYRGSYTEYEVRRRTELEQLIKKWEEQQREIARQEQFIRRFRAQANKARQVQSRIKMLEKVEVLEIPEHLRPVTIVLPPPPRAARHVIETESLSRSYGSTRVLRDLSITVERGRRLAVVGRNGAGKSTLLRILAAQDKDFSGSFTTGTGVQCGYFAQDSPDTLPPDKTVIRFLEEQAGEDARSRVRDLLGAFLFSGDTVDKSLQVLSGGERTRLAMASLLVRPLNLLVLDEPTNHLDMTSQEVLSRALRDYAGTVVFVSHDRTFLRSVATDVLALWPDDRVVPLGWQLYPGTYQEFEESHLGSLFTSPEDQPLVTEERVSRDGGSRSYEEQKARKGEIRRLEQLEKELLARIDTLETQHRELQAELSDPEVYINGDAVRERQRQLLLVEEESAKMHGQWEAAVLRLENLDI